MTAHPFEPDPEAKAYWALILDEYGVDLAEIRANLRLSPAQRLLQAQAGRRRALDEQCGRRPGRPEDDDAESLHLLLAIKRIREEKQGDQGQVCRP